MASAFSSSMLPPGWSRIVAARWATVVDPAHRLADGDRVREVAERDLDAHPVRARAAADRGRGSGPRDPPSSSRSSSAEPTSPVAPVSRITVGLWIGLGRA